jgi:hypothetical protein
MTGLYECSNLKRYEPLKLGSVDLIEKARKNLPKQTFDKLCRTFDNAICNLKPSQNSALIWTKCGAIVGHKTKQPHEAILHLWEKTEQLFGDEDEFGRMFMGSMLMWRISLLTKDQWITYKQDHPSGALNPNTGKVITERHYWVNNEISVPKSATAFDLMAKFNNRK